MGEGTQADGLGHLFRGSSVSNTDPPPQTELPPVTTPPATRRWLRRVGEAVIVLVLILGVRAWQQSGVASGPAPALAGTLLDDKPFALKAFAGQPVLVHFWATWCPICRAEQGSIDDLARTIPVITVAMQSGDRNEVAQYLRKAGLSFPVLNDPNGMIATQWGVRAVPASFIVDGTGQIRYVEVGYTTAVGLRLRWWLASLWWKGA
jgi:DsbE subfamily thiol:disulfide oxidoreductase